MTTAQKLWIDTSATARQMADTMFGDGVRVVSASISGDPLASGIYAGGDAVSPGVVPADSGVILSTGRATDFTNSSGAANKSPSTSTDLRDGIDNNADMNAIAGVRTFDATFFNATFVPEGDLLTMRLIFASEEYLEWVKAGFNDAVGVWVNGQRLSLSIGEGDISIDNINTQSNPNLFRDNSTGLYNTEMDGVTVTLTMKANVLAGQENTIRIGIADAGDAFYDSALLIVANSIQTALVAQDDEVFVTTKGEATVDLLADDIIEGRDGVRITRINDREVPADGRVTLDAGQIVEVDAKGNVTFLATNSAEPVSFTYTITDSLGLSDTAFVKVTMSPVDGTAGNDSIGRTFVDAQGNAVDGRDGLSEVIFGYGGNDRIDAGFGHDEIFGGDGNDFIRGEAGDDLIFGGRGNDVLDGGAGADRMEGGDGNDIYYVSEVGDVVVETGTGRDKVMSDIDFLLSDLVEELWLNKGTAAVKATGNALDNLLVGNENDNVISGFGGKDVLHGRDGADELSGGAGNDVLHGDGGNDLLFGGAGRDKLYGGAGSNILHGGGDNDLISAGSSGDLLIGGAGNDILGGGAGADVFLFTAGDGTDIIKHFDFGIDRLEFGGIALDTVQLKATALGVLLAYGDGDIVHIRGQAMDPFLTLDDLLLV